MGKATIMVILTTAAISAAGYGLYKGGEVVVEKGKEIHREFKSENRRSSQRAELMQKTKSRSERISQLADMKHNGWNVMGNVPNFITNHSSSTNTNSMSVWRQRSSSVMELSTTSTVDDRHKKVMKKLMSGRQKEDNFNRNSKNKLRFNPFQNKKRRRRRKCNCESDTKRSSLRAYVDAFFFEE